MEQNYQQEYNRWLDRALDDPTLNEELRAIVDKPDEVGDRFYRDLAFGTGGLRGVMGAGTNRMNLYTVRKATQGLADYLLGQGGPASACIAYDTRNHSAEFARTAAGVLCANGIKTYLFEGERPTPMLSFAVRRLGAGAGIVLTASHNPKEYNGYKVYGSDGGQITDEAATAILARIEACDVLEGARFLPYEAALRGGLLHLIGEEVDAAYFERVRGLCLRRELLEQEGGGLKILYTPLHGSGNLPVRRMLRELGFSAVDVVELQEQPDGNFPTVPYPNPEEPAVYALAIEQAKRTSPDLILATDPDCDRIGVLARDDRGAFTVLSGNQTGALLCDYILRTRRELGCLPENAAVVKTIVTTDLADEICRQYGTALCEVLTGFKYIGEKAGEWERTGEHAFLFGFEESYGCLAGDFVRDKDAVIAAALIAEMALWYQQQGMTLFEAREALFTRYGHYAEKLLSVTLPGKAGQERIAGIIEGLRADYRDKFAGCEIAVVEDYQRSLRMRGGVAEPLGLPKSNVLKFIFSDGGWLVLRPSGTEPKIKLYLSVCGASGNDTARRLERLETLARRVLEA